MKKSLCVMIVLIALIIFSGCSKNELNYTVTEDNGIKTFRNKNIPADPNFKINLSKVAEINFSDVEVEGEKQGIVIENVKLDKYGNIYNIDRTQQKIFKFDSEGKFLRTIGNRGNGPGEFRHETRHYEIFKDTIFVSVPHTWKMVKFNLDGEFLSSKQYKKASEFPDMFWLSGRFFCAMSFVPIPQEGQDAYYIKLNLFDDQLNYVNSFYEHHVNYAIPEIDLNKPHRPVVITSSDSLIFVPKYSYSDYQIDVFDFKGEKKQSIRKEFRAVQFTDNEFEQIRKNVGNEYKISGKFKNSIEFIWMDKFERIWVRRAQSENEFKEKDIKVYDIFENGIFINQVTLQFNDWTFLGFSSDKLLAMDFENNKVTVYEY